MNLLKRLWKICRAELSSWLDMAEDPTKNLGVALHELLDQQREAREKVVRALATKKQLERGVKTATERADRYRLEAQHAVQAGDAVRARRALGECQKLLVVADRQGQSLQSVTEEVKVLQSALSRLGERVEAAGNRRVDLGGRLEIGEAKLAVAKATEQAALLEGRALGSVEAELEALAERLNSEGEARLEMAGESSDLDVLSRQLSAVQLQCTALQSGSGGK